MFNGKERREAGLSKLEPYIITGPYGNDGKRDVSVAIVPRDPRQHSTQVGLGHDLLLDPEFFSNLYKILLDSHGVEEQGYKLALEENEGSSVAQLRIKYKQDGFLERNGFFIHPDDEFWNTYIDQVNLVLGFPDNPEEHPLCRRHGVEGTSVTYFISSRRPRT